jgi:CHASE2 domain-containing sensor protein
LLQRPYHEASGQQIALNVLANARPIIYQSADQMLGRKNRVPVGSWVGGLLTISLGLLLLLTAFGDPLTRRSYDWLVTSRKVKPPTEAAIIYLDEPSHAELQQPYDCAWDRALHAQLVEKLTEQNARCVVFDIVFDEEGRDPKADARFAEAIGRSKRVVLAGFEEALHLAGGNSTRTRPPLELFRAVAAAWGLTGFPAESDQVIRRHLISDAEVPSLSAAVAWFLQVNPQFDSE